MLHASLPSEVASCHGVTLKETTLSLLSLTLILMIVCNEMAGGTAKEAYVRYSESLL